jgi:hypothetical protein
MGDYEQRFPALRLKRNIRKVPAEIEKKARQVIIFWTRRWWWTVTSSKRFSENAYSNGIAESKAERSAPAAEERLPNLS